VLVVMGMGQTGEYHLDLIVSYGAVPVIVPRVSGVHSLLDSFEPIHGVLLCEGEDVDPTLYESDISSLTEQDLEEIKAAHSSNTSIDKDKDSIELQVCVIHSNSRLNSCRMQNFSSTRHTTKYSLLETEALVVSHDVLFLLLFCAARKTLLGAQHSLPWHLQRLTGSQCSVWRIIVPGKTFYDGTLYCLNSSFSGRGECKLKCFNFTETLSLCLFLLIYADSVDC
jgi:hypothetical protein